MNSSAASAPVLPRKATLLWTFTAGGAIRGVSLARESGSVLVRDDNHWLYLLNRSGVPQAQVRAPKDLTVSACSDEGQLLVAGGKEGDLWSLAPDLMPRWQQNLGKRVEAVAVDPVGQHVAASDTAGNVSLFTRKGHLVWQVKSPRLQRFLAFIPEKPYLIGASDVGLVHCLDARGQLVWRDGLVAHVGALSASGDGSSIVLACYSDGIHRYSIKESRPVRIPLPEVCRFAAVSYDGAAILTAGLTSMITLRDRHGRAQGEYNLDAPAGMLALSPLGDRSLAGNTAGVVSCIAWR
jgi:hypothetical protein